MASTAGEKFNKMRNWRRGPKQDPLVNKDRGEIKINTKKTKCKYCGYEAFYEFKRCSECGKAQER